MWIISARCVATFLLLCLPAETFLVSPVASRVNVKLDTFLPAVVVAASNGDERQKQLSLQRGGPSSSFLDWYKSSLQLYPIRTKCLSSSIIGCIGSVLSQAILATVSRTPLRINARQVATFGLIGLVYIGPFYHFWFDQLSRVGSWLQDRHGSSQQKQVLLQLALDQTVGVILFFPVYFLVFEVLDALVSWRGESKEQ
jgi:hypothetical protein